ncbi:hypothetical protein, partial [Staphylococcus aureus]|uniref:hypothetical protein n=1 Tax=Staphylococcus aureus TaxID=1280 RepID=UPI000F4091F6
SVRTSSLEVQFSHTKIIKHFKGGNVTVNDVIFTSHRTNIIYFDHSYILIIVQAWIYLNKIQ